jgi:DMSO/TMAO reductase YedYZ molybdopterin-dependent catalytic subunit
MTKYTSKHPVLPPGQVLTQKFPVVGQSGKQVSLPEADWRLIVSGLLSADVELSLSEIQALPQREQRTDIHCVTGWSRLGTTLTGIPLALFLDTLQLRPSPGARFVRFVSYSEGPHDTSLPLDVALSDTWLVHSIDGQPLTIDHGYPLRTVTPSRYFYKSLKWLHRIEFLAEDRLGFWERESHYHNNADPWLGDQRYTSGSHDPGRVQAFREAASYLPYRGPKKLFLTVDLRGWAPKTKELGDLHIKNSDLRYARLDGVDLRKANLTRCDLRGASLAGADLREADLEGASLVGADLTRADLRGAALSAARFFERDPEGRLVAAKIDGLQWEGASGLLEDQEAFLRGKIG